jgi:hypothetical protein
MDKVLYTAHILHQEEILKKRKCNEISNLFEEKVFEINEDGELNIVENEEHGDEEAEETNADNSIHQNTQQTSLQHTGSYKEYTQKLAVLTESHYKETVQSEVMTEYLEDAMKGNLSFDPNRQEVSLNNDIYLYRKIDAEAPKKVKMTTFKKLRGKVGHHNLIPKQKFLDNADALRQELESLRTSILEGNKKKRRVKIIEG